MKKRSINGFIDQLNEIPPEAQKILSEIREEDKKVLQLEMEIEPVREDFLEKLSEIDTKKSARQKQKLEEQFREVCRKTQQQLQVTKKKILLAEKLYNCIDEPTQLIDREISLRYSNEEASHQKQKNVKSKRSKHENEWEYDASQPHYCYCKRPSFGFMVMCENTLCETQWFHVSCVEEKITNGEKWYCRECRKGKFKPRAPKKGKKIL